MKYIQLNTPLWATNILNLTFASAMGFLKRLYRENIYGVMGTLVFHILVISGFLLAEMNMKKAPQQSEIIIEVPVVKEDEPESGKEEAVQKGLTPNQVSDALRQPGGQGLTNMPSNKLATTDRFFDDDYVREVKSAQNLVKEVNKQLSKKTASLDEIKMPVETTEGLNPEEVKNKNYVGDSNISYFLENRYHLSLPVPVYLAKGGGKVVVDISVNRDGKVLEAEPRSSPGIKDQLIYEYSRIAALRTVFNADQNAPARQTGTIHYTFIAQ
jgi:hypothetical protein